MKLLSILIINAHANGFDYIYSSKDSLDIYRWQILLLMAVFVAILFFIFRPRKGK